MGLEAYSTEAAPIRFGREEPYDYDALDEFLDRNYAPSPCRAIHLGCGDGRITVYLAQRGYQMLGIDPDRGQLASARERAVMAGVDIDLMAGDPMALPPLPEESFCLAVDLWTAATIPDGLEREDYLRRVYRLLMRDGVLVASAPAPSSRSRKAKPRKRTKKKQPFAFGGPFVSDFTRAGFEVVFEGVRYAPQGEQRHLVHAKKSL